MRSWPDPPHASGSPPHSPPLDIPLPVFPVMSEPKVRHFQDWWKAKFGFVPHGDRVVCTLCHKSIVTRTSSVRRHFNTKHGPLIPPSSRSDYIRLCVAAFENMQPRPELDPAKHQPGKRVMDEKRSPSPDTKICLKWNTYHNNIQTIFPTLLLNEQFVDVTLACEGRFMKCHKVILSACSPYFEELLSQNPCQHPIVLMKDIKFWEIRALVEFMYSGEVNVAEEKLPSLLRAAEALQVKGLTSVPQTTNNDSADSEEKSFDKVKGFPSPKTSIRRRKRKLSDSTGKSNESSQNDLPTDKKLFKEEQCNPQSTSSCNIDSSSLQMYELYDSSNHPPIDNKNSNTCQVPKQQKDTQENKCTFIDSRTISPPDEEKDELVSDETSHESDSEQENYIFSMGKRPVADQAVNLRRQTGQEKKPIDRIQNNSTNK